MTATFDAARWLDAAAARTGRYADMVPLLDHLRASGWTEERLAKNDLIPRFDKAGKPLSYEQFWRTIDAATKRLVRLGVPPIVIKSVREYPYSDSNVDVLVPRAEFRRCIDAFVADGWGAPEPWDRFEQALIERAKMKLPSEQEGILSVHFYGAVSWRYQSDIGLLRNGSEPDPTQLELVSTADFQQGIAEPARVWIPKDAAELVLQAAHVAFENYRMTLGEAIHVQLLARRNPGAVVEAYEIARRHGCTASLDMALSRSAWMCAHMAQLDPRDLPLTLPAREVAGALRQRVSFLLGSGRVIGAVNEAVTSTLVNVAVRSIRRFRRFRRGHEDYR